MKPKPKIPKGIPSKTPVIIAITPGKGGMGGGKGVGKGGGNRGKRPC